MPLPYDQLKELILPKVMLDVLVKLAALLRQTGCAKKPAEGKGNILMFFVAVSLQLLLDVTIRLTV